MPEDKNIAARAKLRYLRIAPRKVRQVANLMRGKKVGEAQTLLQFLPKRASLPLAKLLKSATASAKNNFQLQEHNLYISKITVDEGPKLKRWRARARGQAYEIQKKTSHVTLILDEIEKKPKKVKKPKREKVRPEKVEKIERGPKVEKPKLRPEKETRKPKIERGIRRIFRRKAF
jgi:large subunit ribosomal protein L22